MSTTPSLLKDINLLGSSIASLSTQFTNVNGTAFFQANDATNGFELWKSNGTAGGTALVKNIGGATSLPPDYLTNVSGTLFFTGDASGSGPELWKSNGTSAGTVLVKDIWPGGNGSYPGSLTNVNGTLFFVAVSSSSGDELWKSNGTSAGTVRVKDILPGASSSYPANLTNVNGTLFFLANDGTSGYELWRSNGTSAGTLLVKDILPGAGWSYPNGLTDINGTLFFAADDGANGTELWKSDGTSAGTVLVKDIRSGASGSGPQNLTNVAGMLFFVANDGANGTELWKSDGTSAGTVRVKDIRPGVDGSSPASLTNVAGILFFQATDGTSGPELWMSNGTSAGTTLAGDIRAGSSGSDPSNLANIGGTLFFSADDGIKGREPWTVGPLATVTGRRLFYNQSAFDGNNASINSSDDAAIAPDKTAYLPGDGLAGFQNVSSYSRGINGIMIDLAGSGDHSSISLSTVANDFVFKVGNNNTPSSWAAAPTPSAVSVRTNFDGSGTDRVVITWANNAIDNEWLEVQVLPTSRTGLTATDVFFWGNKIGDIGSPTASTFTTTAAGDANPIIAGGLGPAGGITNVRDIDRSNTITAAGDRSAAIANIGALTRINIGSGGPFAPDGDAGVAWALASSSTTATPARPLPQGVARRLSAVDSLRNSASRYFAELAGSAAEVEIDTSDVDSDRLDELLAAIASAGG